MIVDRIYNYLSEEEVKLDEILLDEVGKIAKFSFYRQFMKEREERKLRLSSSGDCIRKLAYIYLGFEEDGKKIDARGKLTFFLGDLTELAILKLARLSGCHIFATGLEQLEVSINIDGVEIVGHPDGLFLHKGTTYLVECKSMSDYGFKDFEKGNISSSYIAQVNMYMYLLNIKNAIFLALNKNNSVLGEKIVSYSPKVVSEVIERFRKVIHSTKDNLPEREFKPDKNGKLPWQCSYCPFWKICYKKAEKKLVGRRNELFIKNTRRGI